LLRQDLGRTISTIVPTTRRRGHSRPAQPGPDHHPGDVRGPSVPRLYPRASGARSAAASRPTRSRSSNARPAVPAAPLDQNVGAQDQLFVRYTFDDAEQLLPTDFLQFPRTFQSRNHFATAEYRQVSSGTPSTRRAQLRADASDAVQAPGVASPPFVPGRLLVGDIDIGGTQVRASEPGRSRARAAGPGGG
jgi:hypothetical protein